MECRLNHHSDITDDQGEEDIDIPGCDEEWVSGIVYIFLNEASDLISIQHLKMGDTSCRYKGGKVKSVTVVEVPSRLSGNLEQ